MAFTLIIKSNETAGVEPFDFGQFLENCGMRYGSNNSFYVLEEEKINQGTVILYNPSRIGRGIFLNMQQVDEGEITISYNIPTTGSEIEDFIRAVAEIERQMKSARMYCEEEEREYTLEELVENKAQMEAFSLRRLNEFCQREDYAAYIFTLVMWPVFLTDEDVKRFAVCNKLEEFEEYIHEKQAMDVYYAKPRLLRNSQTNKIGAFYVLTEECESIFPVSADEFINQDGIQIDEGFVQFYIYSEDRMVDRLFDYEKFMKYLLEHGVEYFDASHVLVPSLTKDVINEMVRAIE